MQRKILTGPIYLTAALATSAWWFASEAESQQRRAAPLLYFVPLLFFAYAYARVKGQDTLARVRPVAAFAAIALVLMPLLFALRGAGLWRNSPGETEGLLIVGSLLVSSILFLVSGASLLARKKSSLSGLGLILLLPTLFLVGGVSTVRFFDETVLTTACYFLCLVSALILVFAAGLISTQPSLAHASALAGCLIAIPWHYLSEFRNLELVNSWILFNVPDRDLMRYDALLPPKLNILSVALLTVSMTIAILRLLPQRWRIKDSSVRDWSWPAFLAAGLLMALWFSKATMPYRIPGAVDYSDYPVFQILHIEKYGLQFRETCISFYDQRRARGIVGVFADDRRLFQYRFGTKRATAALSSALLADFEKAKSDLSGAVGKKSDPVTPLRAWTSDAWYVSDRYSGFHAFTTQNGKTPPASVVALFHEVDKASTPTSVPEPDQLKDVCLGFCFDQLSAMGYLFSNHRCFNDGHGTRCR